MDMYTPEKAFEQYRSLVEDNDAAMPILMFAGEHQLGLAGLEVGEEGIQPVLAQALPHMKSQLGQPRWLVLSMESFMKPFEKDERVYEFQPGDLQRAHAAGDVAVRDCVMISAVSAGGERWNYMRLFTRTDTGITWEEPTVSYDAAGGVIDLLFHAVR